MGARHSTTVFDATCEAFAARYVRLVITAADDFWLEAAAQALCGYGTSVIGCDAEIAVERSLTSDLTPDGRSGVSVLAFAFRKQALGDAVANRVGQTLLTCPTAAVFDGLPEAEDRASLGNYLRYFGDGHETESDSGWTIPVMEGEVTLPATIGVGSGVAGGNLLLCGRDQPEALEAARRAVDAVRDLPGVIMPFPGGACRSGSKVGSRYRRLIASTNEAFCPTLRTSVETRLPEEADCVYELILNATDEPTLRTGMKAALHAAMDGELLAVTAAAYSGKLGKTMIPVQSLLGGKEQ